MIKHKKLTIEEMKEIFPEVGTVDFREQQINQQEEEISLLKEKIKTLEMQIALYRVGE